MIEHEVKKWRTKKKIFEKKQIRNKKENGMGEYNVETALRKRKKTGRREEEREEDGGCVCNVFRGNTFVPCTLFTPPPTNPTRHDIIPLIYPLSSRHPPGFYWSGRLAVQLSRKRFVKRPA